MGRPGRAQAAYDVTATTDLVMRCFRKKPFEDLMATTPHIAQRLLEMTLDESLDAAREWMLLLGRKTAREKIASLLAIIARRDASLKLRSAQGALAFDLPLTREEMADYLGLTLETVSRQVSALKRDGLIRPEGKRHVVVPDFDALLEHTGDDLTAASSTDQVKAQPALMPSLRNSMAAGQKPGQRRLHQVQPDEHREPDEQRRDKGGQHHTQQDHGARKQHHRTVEGHFSLLRLGWGRNSRSGDHIQ